MLARHGRDPETGEECGRQNGKVHAYGHTRWAVFGCTCGLADYVGVDPATVMREMVDEFGSVDA